MVSPDLARPVLFVSNGYGEDVIAAGIVEALLRRGVRVMALPLVGEGHAYARVGAELVGPRELMPSGGLIMENWARFFTDVGAGLWRLTSGQIRTLRGLAPSLGAVVAVGDTYPVVLAGLFSSRRVIMVGTAKSNYFYPYSAIERAVFKRHCAVVFARDEPTAATLRAQGVEARWVGNCMMDLLGQSGEPLPLDGEGDVIAVLPGSRKTAYTDLPVLLDAMVRLGAARPFRWVTALADSVETPALAGAAGAGWSLEPAEGTGVDGRLVGHGQRVLLVRGRFGDVLHASRMVIGQAGTGNEQAVGLGRPVVSFDSEGKAKPGWYRARQIGLLGDSMAVVPRSGEAIAAEVLAVLDDGERFARMQQIGYERMGPPGACDAIASCVAEIISQAPGSRGIPCPTP